ncbi:MAG: ATP synthase F1 subunit epsilon [Actinobacteria bacterium]|nr:ATP synthase F1 subunit epsilon [Actinomycetota bacterium]
MADRKLLCEVVSPENIVYSGEADMVVALGVEGELGIMPRHIPIVTPLALGELRILNGGQRDFVSVLGGYLEFRNDKLTILADAAELSHEIDIARAEAKRLEREAEIAEARASGKILLEAEVSLRKALVRLRVAQKG